MYLKLTQPIKLKKLSNDTFNKSREENQKEIENIKIF